MVYAAYRCKSVQNDRASRPHVRRCPDPLQQVLERPCGRDAHQQDVALRRPPSNRTRPPRYVLGARGIIWLRRIKRSDSHERRQQMPNRLGIDSRRISLDHTTRLQPAHSRWTAETDSPARVANSDSVARPSAASSRTRIRSISSSASFMAGDYRNGSAA